MSEQSAKVGAFRKMGGAIGAAAGSGKFWFGVDLVSNVSAGDNLGTSVLKAGATGILSTAAPVLFGVASFAPAVRDMGVGYYNFRREKQSWWNKQFAYDNSVGGNYVDSQRALTMRQAAVQSIQGSKLNARSALGSEARILNPYNSRKF